MEKSADMLYADGPDALLSEGELGAMSGLDFLSGIRDGRHPQPPICQTLGFRLVEVESGRAVFEGRATFDSYNPLGAVHGGWFGAVLDSAMSCAVQSRLPRGQGYTTLEYKIGMVRPVTVDTGPLRAVGQTVHVGRRTGLAEGRLIGEDDKIYATGSATCLVFAIGGER